MITTYIKFTSTTLLAFLLFAPSLSRADLTGRDLLDDCQIKLQVEKTVATEKITPADAFQAGACTGYIKGFDDMEILYASILAGPDGTEKDAQKYSLYCLPDKTTNVQMASAVVKYIKSHPKELDDSASIVAAKAFRDAYPCPKFKSN